MIVHQIFIYVVSLIQWTLLATLQYFSPGYNVLMRKRNIKLKSPRYKTFILLSPVPMDKF